uniref:UDP-D-xylose:beta-D-glucoside alpha-1,3-D-xylosyltransferase n=1 Tax=Hirondellea gigas TaxID=1518452 RepID=A0A6A7G324_9CRUS
MRNMFRECATERLFLPQMLPTEDALIYLDTDLIFMRPPEELWHHFYNFNEKQVAAMAPCLFHYGTSPTSKTPYYGRTGLNAGVMHMNLTRMKHNFPDGGWIQANMAAFDQYKEAIALADQDILNIVFNKHPDLLYELECDWNYRAFQCSNGSNHCPITDTQGTSIIHGNALTFVSSKESKIKAVYDSWRHHVLGAPLRQLYTGMRERLREVSKLKLPSECAHLKNIDIILTQRLSTYIKNLVTDSFTLNIIKKK